MSQQYVKAIIAAALKQAREKAGLSQKQLADKLNVKQPVISEIESGTANTTAETIERYANALNMVPVFKLTKPRQKKDKTPKMSTCTVCMGSGWEEGGKSLQTTCHYCGGTGEVPR